jgi:hypothetical protein
LTIHAEVKAMQEKYGLSYKDAAHRLYHSEVQKLKAEDIAYRSMQEMNQQNSSIVQDLQMRIDGIDFGVSQDSE